MHQPLSAGIRCTAVALDALLLASPRVGSPAEISQGIAMRTT